METKIGVEVFITTIGDGRYLIVAAYKDHVITGAIMHGEEQRDSAIAALKAAVQIAGKPVTEVMQ